MLDSLTTPLEPFFQQSFLQWLLHTSWQAGVLVCLILLAQKALGRWLGARGSYCLWLVLLIRLALPAAPHTRVSVYNLLPPPRSVSYGLAATVPPRDSGSPPAAMDETATAQGQGEAGPAAAGTRETRAAPGPGARAGHWLPGRATTLLLLWLTGVCVLTGYVAAGYIRLWRIVRCARPVTDRRVLGLLTDCQRRMGLQRVVGVAVTDRIGGPALFGFLRPRLLLPRAALAELGLQELRHVFLHELAHLRRDDIVLGYLATLLQILHWFNPLLALGLKRMRADRELVCDALALSSLPPEENTAYGHTIVRQIERSLTSRPQRMLAALSGDKARVQQRIALIVRFPQGPAHGLPLALVLVALLACTGLTNGLPVYQFSVYGPARDVPTTHQDKHANIERIILRHRDTGKCLVVRGPAVTCDANEPGDAGLWEARFDVNYAQRDQIVYFYSVAACKYLLWDKEGNVAVSGREPNETARWCVLAHTSGARISPYPFAHVYLRPAGQGRVKGIYGTDPSIGWDVDALWRVKTSDDDPTGNAQWHREHIPGPDWGPPWSTRRRPP